MLVWEASLILRFAERPADELRPFDFLLFRPLDGQPEASKTGISMPGLKTCVPSDEDTGKMMADPFSSCPNCGTACPPGAQACPNCGYLRPNAPAWPPPLGVAAPPPPPEPKLVTGAAWGDVTLGLGISFLSNFLACAGFIVMPILYFTLKPKYPLFTRGIGYGTLAGLALLLGAVVWCFAGLANSHGG